MPVVMEFVISWIVDCAARYYFPAIEEQPHFEHILLQFVSVLL